MDVNGQLHAPANLPQWKTLPLSLQLEVRWANLDTLKSKISCPYWEPKDYWSFSLNPSRNTDHIMPFKIQFHILLPFTYRSDKLIKN